MTVPRDHLGGRHRPQSQRVADVGLDRGIDVGVGADRAGQLADGDGVASRTQPPAVAVGLQCPEGQLGPEGGRLGVDAVGAADHGGVAELEGPALQRPDQV